LLAVGASNAIKYKRRSLVLRTQSDNATGVRQKYRFLSWAKVGSAHVLISKLCTYENFSCGLTSEHFQDLNFGFLRTSFTKDPPVKDFTRFWY